MSYGSINTIMHEATEKVMQGSSLTYATPAPKQLSCSKPSFCRSSGNKFVFWMVAPTSTECLIGITRVRHSESRSYLEPLIVHKNGSIIPKSSSIVPKNVVLMFFFQEWQYSSQEW